MKCNLNKNKAKLHSVDKGREGILLNKSMNTKLLSPLVLMLNIGLLTFTFMSCLTNKECSAECVTKSSKKRLLSRLLF